MSTILKSFLKKDIPENYFRAEVYILRYTGIELVREETFWYQIYSKIALFVLVYSYTCVEGFELYAEWGDLNSVTNVLNFLVTHIIGSIKITFLFIHRKRFKEMMRKLHEHPFIPDEKRGGPDEVTSVRRVVKKTEIQLVIYCSMVSMVVFGGLIDSMKVIISSPREKWHLPFLNISLIDTSYTPVFAGAYFYQLFCIVAVAAQIAATDVLRTAIMAHLSVQLNILQNSLRNMKQQVLYLEKSKGQGSSLVYFKNILNTTVNHHMEIFELGKEIEACCSTVVLIIMLSSVMQLCFLMYQTSLIPLQSVTFVQYFVYYCVIATQAFQYCYWGDEVSREAAGVARGVSDSDWPDMPSTVSKSMVLVMARSQRPFYISAGNFVPLSLQVFMSIVKGSFSYFMVLRQMNIASK